MAGKCALSVAGVWLALLGEARAQQIGIWGIPNDWPLVAVHMVHQPSGKVLVWGYDGVGAQVWNPLTGGFMAVSNMGTNVFCSGHSALSDGRAILAGGHVHDSVGLPDTNLFDPATEQWLRVSDMAFARWYPTCTTLPDGRVLASSGDITVGQNAIIPEVFDPRTDAWTALNDAARMLPLYPFMFVLPDGRVFYAGPFDVLDTYCLDLSDESWSWVGDSVIAGGSAVMYEPGKILKCGGPSSALDGTNIKDSVVIDMNLPAAGWRTVGAMAFARRWHNLTLLPDGSVLATGGAGRGNDVLQAVYAAELFDPQTELWTTLASMELPRLYHSTALLLDDARVLSAGGDEYPSAEIFSPPYLFRGPRPVIITARRAAAYGQTFAVATPGAGLVGKINLIRLGSVTHGFDQNQRLVPLAFTEQSDGVEVLAPANANVAPPGFYMMYLISAAGTPSMAHMINIITRFGDHDADSDVDLVDSAAFLNSMEGPDLGPPAFAHRCHDFDGDDNVDFADFADFQREFMR